MLALLLLSLQLLGLGTIDDTVYQMNAQISKGQETRLSVQYEDEALNLILSKGKIYDDHMNEQKLSQLFAKMVCDGLLDPFFVLEIVSGERKQLYEPYMHKHGDIVSFIISPEDCLAIYESWIIDFPIIDGILRQTLMALNATIEYDFHICPTSGNIVKIEVASRHYAPQLRKCQGTFTLVQYQEPLPSS